MTDGWSCAGIHYFVIYHQWPSLAVDGETIEVKRGLLSCAPSIIESSLGANSQADSILSIYILYGPPQQLIISLTLDNTNTNPATARLLKKPMIRAYYHRLNLALCRWLEQIFDGVLMRNLQVSHAVMVHAITLKGQGKLKEYTGYVPSIQNKTRWVCYPNMAIKYHKMHTALEESGLYDSADVEGDEGEDIEVQENDIIKRVKNRQVLLTGSTLDTFKDDMEKLKMFFKMIQKDDLDLPAALQCFHAAKSHPLLNGHSTECEEHLLPTHWLVVVPRFESGVCKIIEGEIEGMTPNEKKACEPLIVQEASAGSTRGGPR
eukprot:scaffold34610_cov197-Amphora_coffeaeformis.AAC.8